MSETLSELFRGVAVHANADQEHKAALELLTLVMVADQPAKVFAVAKPRSLWQCVLHTTEFPPGVCVFKWWMSAWYSFGVVYLFRVSGGGVARIGFCTHPTVSGMLMVFAPALITSPHTWTRNSLSDLHPSSVLNSTSSARLHANFTAATAFFTHSSREILSL